MTERADASNLTMGNLWASIWKISWPMLLIMVFYFFVGFADIYVAGLISPEVQAAVGFVGQIYFLVIIVANAVSIGTLVLVSRAVGARNLERALEVARQSIAFSLIIAAALTIAVLLFNKEIIAVAGFPAQIRGMAENFLRIFALSLGPYYVLIVSNAIFRASGEVRKPLLTMFLVSLVNITGDFVLVFGIFPFPEMGYIGIAISTAISVTAGMVVSLVFFRSGRWRSFYSRPWGISKETVMKIVTFGWPAGLLQIAWNAGTIVLYHILGRLGSASITALAALSNGLRIEAVIYLPAFALNMAASVLIGQNLGAGDPARAERVGWKIAQAGVFLMSLMALVIFIWADRFASVVTRDPSVLAETTRYLRINMFSEPFMALSSILGGGLQGAGDTKGAMRVIVTAMWLIRLPLAFFLALVLGYGATGAWVAMISSMTVQGVLMALRFYKGKWKGLKVD
ncbi:MAG: MATE family efflux transporter [Nitrospirae bacterium]|nr:MATE family efflux transporter [Nitrospirota bacterium]